MASPLDPAKKFCSLFSYKPGFKIEPMHHETRDAIIIRFWRMVPDSTGESQTPITQVSRVEISCDLFFTCKDEFEKLIKSLIIAGIRDMELHEFDEWLKFDGKHISNPHPDK